MTTSISRHLACLFLVLAGAPAIAVAGKAEDEAKAHVAKATRAHQDGNFEEARAELEAAYALDPRPDLLYALGQVHAKLGDCREATSYYRRFAASQKDPQVAKVVDQAIAACKPASDTPPAAPSDTPPADAPSTAPPAADAAPRTTAASPSTATPRPSPFGGGTRQVPVAQRTPWYKDKLGDGLVLGGVVASVIGLVQYRSALSDLDEAEDRASTTTLARYEELVDGAGSKRTTALLLAGAGGALIAAGVVRFVLVEGNTETRNVAIAPARGGGVVTYGGSF
jgi:tetratricopeptide (TPR) repeat protein